MKWHDISTRPTEDQKPFLALLPGNDVADFVVVQVSPFEGQIYPDHLDGLVNWDDRVITATHWSPIGSVPHVIEIEQSE